MSITTTAPYTSGSAITTVIERYREKGLSTPINADVLLRAGVSESLIPRTLPALVLLELIDDAGLPTNTFQKMRTVPQDQYQAFLADWLRSVYADVFQFADPQKDDATRVRDAFRTYVPHGQQDRMVSLFLALCAEAGICGEVKKSDSKSTARKPQSRAPAQRVAKSTANSHIPAQQPARSGLDTSGFPPVLAGMLQSIPSPQKGWTQAERDRFLATFPTVLDFSIPVVKEPQPDQEEEVP